jgi:CheY-like chemotaxis protein
LPQFDGHQFFQMLRSGATTQFTPFIFISDQKGVDDKIQSIELGVDDYISKPYHIEEVLARVELILQEAKALETIRKQTERIFSGSLSEMNLVDLIQTLELGKKSGILRLIRNGKEGVVFIEEGEVLDASLEDLDPETALLRMFTWLEGDFRAEINQIDHHKALPMSNKELISKGIERVSQWRQLQQQLPPLHTVVMTKTPLPDTELSKEERAIVNLLNGNRRISDIVEESSFDDLEALEIVKELYIKDLLQETNLYLESEHEHLIKLKAKSERRRAPREGFLSRISSLFKRSDDWKKKVDKERRRYQRRQISDRRQRDRRWDGSYRQKNKVYLNRSELMMIREKLL